MRTAETIRQEIRKIREISTLPQVMQRVMQIIIDERSSARDLADEISRDQALTAKILKIVNSAFFGFYRKISSIQDAVVILGYSEVRSIAITVSVFNLLGQGKRGAHFDRVRLWEHCLAVGTLADILRRECVKTEQGEGAFVAGLLHDIGKVILDEYFAPEWTEVVRCSQSTGRAIRDVEDEMLGITHGEIGYLVCERWNLPPAIDGAILRHHTPPLGREGGATLDALVYLANTLVKKEEIGFSGDCHLWPVTGELLQAIDLKEHELETIKILFMKKTAAIKALIEQLSA